MKIRTIAVIYILTVLLTLSLSACGNESLDRKTIPYGKDGAYAGFSDIPSDYTAEEAALDGCLVIDTTREPNVHRVLVASQQSTAGYEHWERFTEQAEAGEDAFLRVAHFIDGTGYYHDLYYVDGWYVLFTWNEYGITKEGSFQYLRCLAETSGAKSHRLYVLTDSMELTYHDVTWTFLSSSLSTVTDIPFIWLGFMTYFE
ncbi:MAG: hypothetical protein IJY12_05095 [Clostridia bacterium]|nr:hypothetical protein [Clostridia bacterium]